LVGSWRIENLSKGSGRDPWVIQSFEDDDVVLGYEAMLPMNLQEFWANRSCIETPVLISVAGSLHKDRWPLGGEGNIFDRREKPEWVLTSPAAGCGEGTVGSDG
jgi:hypothetical protein